MDIEKLVRKEMQGLVRPVHGGLGWQHPGVEDFSSNLNPYGPPPGLEGCFQEALPHLIHYPDDRSTMFRKAICSRFQVNDDNVTVGAGSAEIIRLFPDVFLSPGDRVVMPSPTFSEYAFACQVRGARAEEVPLPDSLRVDIDVMLERCHGAKLIYLCNPNNPTGNIVPRKRVLELVRECEGHGTLVFLDETLLELVDGSKGITCIDEVVSHDNLFIIRSLTKCFAIPGLRIGYAVGSEPIIKHMEAARLSWNLGRVEQMIGAKLLDDHYDHIAKAARMMAGEKVRVAKEVSATGLVKAGVPDAFFNFVPTTSSGKEMQRRILEHNVLVRDCASFGPRFRDFVRFSVKTPEKNDLLIDAFRKVAARRDASG
jgi:threonine-phosphate decarboxylase